MNGFVPYHLRGKDRGDLVGSISLKHGEIYERIGPEDKRNKNKKFDEYRVNVEDESDGHPFTRIIDHCTVISHFGGVADKVHHSLRGEKAASTKKGIGKGSKVLVLHINGNYKNGIIIGGIRDFQDEKDDQNKFKGHYYYWIFNGIETYINDDGEYTLTYKGKTENDGSRNSNVSESSVGSLISLLKDGKIKQVAIKEWRVDVSDGKAIIKPKDGLEVGDATDHMLLGESFRNAEQSMHEGLSKKLSSALGLVTTVGTNLLAAASANATPIVGGLLAAPNFTTAAGTLTSLSSLLGQMQADIEKFEAQAKAKNGFLSKNNKAD